MDRSTILRRPIDLFAGDQDHVDIAVRDKFTGFLEIIDAVGSQPGNRLSVLGTRHDFSPIRRVIMPATAEAITSPFMNRDSLLPPLCRILPARR